MATHRVLNWVSLCAGDTEMVDSAALLATDTYRNFSTLKNFVTASSPAVQASRLAQQPRIQAARLSLSSTSSTTGETAVTQPQLSPLVESEPGVSSKRRVLEMKTEGYQGEQECFLMDNIGTSLTGLLHLKATLDQKSRKLYQESGFSFDSATAKSSSKKRKLDHTSSGPRLASS